MASPMPNEPQGDHDARLNQKRRTRQALIDAALALRDEGRDPGFAEIAERALVSRATAYRYFPSVETLLAEAAAERGMQPLEAVYRPGDDPLAAIERAAREMCALLLRDETGLHVMERAFMSVWLDSEPDARPPRPGRRMQYIEPIVDALKGELTPAARRRLRQALSMVMGTEATLALRDIGGATPDEAVAAAGWAARALVSQALDEARAARRAPAGVRRRAPANGA